jgi:hypothetical protein
MSSGVCRLFHLEIFAKKPGKILVKIIREFAGIPLGRISIQKALQGADSI